MRTSLAGRSYSCSFFQYGVSLLELIFFIVIVSIASSILFKMYNYSLLNNVDPIIKIRAVELAQSKLDEILALKYDEGTPTGGIPACGGTGGAVCTNTPDGNMNDVDDFNGTSDTPYTNYLRTVTVNTASNEKLITVTVTAPLNVSVSLSVYKANF